MSVAVVVDREFGEEEEVVVVVEREGLDGTGTGIVPPRAENIPMTSLVYSLSGSRSILIWNPKARSRATPPSIPVI